MNVLELIDEIGRALPAESYDQIADRVSNNVGYGVSVIAINTGMAYLRRHAAEIGWTVPHCRRGPALPGDDRLFMLLIDHAGDYFVADDPRRGKLREGAIGTLGTIAQQAANLSFSLMTAMSYERSPAKKRSMRTVKIVLDHLELQSANAAEGLREEREEQSA